MLNNWTKSGNTYRIAEISQQMKNLPVGIYKFQVDLFDQPFLAHISEKFDLPFKIYDIERLFIDRVKKSWANTVSNMGILLNGVKGTGKSVTAEILCNEFNLPVIIVPFKHKNLVSFINDIQQDVIIFIDEYDKIFDRYDNSLLSVMDGVLKKDNRCLFLLTSNEQWLERNMLQRPSRIRYVKTFGDLSATAILEIVNDMLIHKELLEPTVKFISYLSIITMDLVKSIIEEVNIHQEVPQAFEDVFNINDGNTQKNTVYLIENAKKVLQDTNVDTDPKMPFSEYHKEEDFYVGREYIGEITQVNGPSEIVVEIVEKNETGEENHILKTYYVEKFEKKHKSFHDNPFVF